MEFLSSQCSVAEDDPHPPPRGVGTTGGTGWYRSRYRHRHRYRCGRLPHLAAARRSERWQLLGTDRRGHGLQRNHLAACFAFACGAPGCNLFRDATASKRRLKLVWRDIGLADLATSFTAVLTGALDELRGRTLRSSRPGGPLGLTCTCS